MKGCCGNCIYWVLNSCHRHAPKLLADHAYLDYTNPQFPVPINEYNTLWPSTNENDSCGDHKLK